MRKAALDGDGMLAVRSIPRAPAAALAVAAGLAIGYLVPSRAMVIAGLAIVLAAVNGYSKAYSP